MTWLSKSGKIFKHSRDTHKKQHSGQNWILLKEFLNYYLFIYFGNWSLNPAPHNILVIHFKFTGGVLWFFCLFVSVWFGLLCSKIPSYICCADMELHLTYICRWVLLKVIKLYTEKMTSELMFTINFYVNTENIKKSEYEWVKL